MHSAVDGNSYTFKVNPYLILYLDLLFMNINYILIVTLKS